MGKNVNIYHDVKIYALYTEIGDNTYIGPESLLAGGTVAIGPNCDISARVVIHSGTHEFGGGGRRAGSAIAGCIEIGSGVWVGAGCVMISGASVGDGAVIGAGSVVRGKIEPNSVAVGVPAKIIRRLD